MTTAARPTFDPARGKENKNPTLQHSARDLASETKLKFRQPGQTTEDEIGNLDLKEQLLQAEREHFQKKQASEQKQAAFQQRLTNEDLKRLEDAADEDADESDSDSLPESDDENLNSDSDLNDSDDDDENAELMRELEKIRQERAIEKERQELEKLEKEKADNEERAILGNPLLFNSDKKNFSVKRRWDEDVIFKNQARGTEDKKPKRFINDLLRSDFHRKFMSKYIQ
ncbi:Cwf15/Cwc15 cell cycle control protein [Conidiobolus coronatus NRRL 28638]|uniref:Cwf15/Cwc15 cell cycle control protein n=1 Tax=Conidiobolus coronatus (strain ATCC 28846 / CBS 209.66 / NRRL 28638) TaxID=796925 RepID=A0A137NTS2_CONC2|nr:Cwf15/Cwc15 cell cycle control protein [Conidiobolus coronatus NRRL 28638]|eukprot:KXN66024.1 Cwf15/Cwc15 cell cycle control protein [Conidiobolus coronatus NRRL 28638]